MNEKLLIETKNMIEPNMYMNGHYMVAYKDDILWIRYTRWQPLQVLVLTCLWRWL